MTPEQHIKELIAQLTSNTHSYQEYAAFVAGVSNLLTTVMPVQIESLTCQHTYEVKLMWTDPGVLYTQVADCPLCSPPDLIDYASPAQLNLAMKNRRAAIKRQGTHASLIVSTVRGARFWLVQEVIQAMAGDPGNEQVVNLKNNLGVTGRKIRELVNDLGNGPKKSSPLSAVTFGPGQTITFPMPVPGEKATLHLDVKDTKEWEPVLDRFMADVPSGQTEEELEAAQVERYIQIAVERLTAAFQANPVMNNAEMLEAGGRPTKYRYPALRRLQVAGHVTTRPMKTNGRKFEYVWHETPVSEPENPDETKLEVGKRTIKKILDATGRGEALTSKQIVAGDETKQLTISTFQRGVKELEQEGYLTATPVRIGGLAGMCLYFTKVVPEDVNGS